MSEKDEEVVEIPPQTLRETGNGPSISYEEALLRQYFGEPDEDGVYGKCPTWTEEEFPVEVKPK